MVNAMELYESFKNNQAKRALMEEELRMAPLREETARFALTRGQAAMDNDARRLGLMEKQQAQTADFNNRRLGVMAQAAANKGAMGPRPERVVPVTIADPTNPNATIIVDGSSGRRIGQGPKLTETGKGNLKQQTNMQGISSDLQKAEDLLMGQQRDSEGNVTPGTKPTGSGIGSAVDYVGALFGASVPGAAEADSLRVVGGRLIQKVPRFEGPQSDKDVKLYQQMAGDAGNEKLPRARRLEAIKTMRQLYSGYEDGSRGRMVQDSIMNPGGGGSGWDAGKEQRFREWKEKQGR